MDDIPLPPAQFADKLYTNYIPNPTEIHQIKQYVANVTKQLSVYDARIAELESAIQHLNNKRSQLSQIANAHESLVSPLRRLPPEILQMIFAFCIPSSRNAVMHASEAPVLLGRVCSQWRRLSLATPEIWSSLHIVPPNVNFSNPASSTARFHRKRELIRTWLGRSGACPLSISFLWLAGDSEDEVKLCGSLLEVLVPMCKRWKVLDFRVPLKVFRPFIGLTVEDVPMLEGMSFMDNRSSIDTDVDRWPEGLGFADSASKLRTFTLTFFSGGIRLPSIPWSQLTSLYLESNIVFFFADSREMLNTLAQCANLQSCTLKFPLSHTTSLPAFENLDIPPITLPRLQILYIDGDQHLHNTFHMASILMNLVAPKLRVLGILGRSGAPEDNNNSFAPEPLSAVRTLLTRSRCPLVRLDVESITILPHEFIECLWLVPSLVHLTVQNLALRMQFGPGPGGGQEEEEEEEDGVGSAAMNGLGHQSRMGSAPDIPENVILKALVLKPNTENLEDIPGSSSSTTTVPSLLCPRLQAFDYTLCDASQSLLCDFIASRWSDVPEGAMKIKSVKCTFTTFEDEVARRRIDQFRSEGLDAFVTYQVSINDDLNSSPWAGLDGPP